MSYDDNLYYYPEKHGAVKLAEHDLAEPCYSFDLLVAWKTADGIYLGTDSGCSCPSPFESYNGLQDATGPLTVEQALEEAANLKTAAYEPNYDLENWNEFVMAVSRAHVIETPALGSSDSSSTGSQS